MYRGIIPNHTAEIAPTRREAPPQEGVRYLKRSHVLSFALTFSIGLLFALYTDHRWEDWYITYRASKNLATGAGLTYTVGQRIYSYTSPINTLLPAAFAAIFRNFNPDEASIWSYRLVNLTTLGFSSVLLLKLAGKIGLDRFHRAAAVCLFAVNVLVVDFTINGMEAPYMIFFLLLLILNLTNWKRISLWQTVVSFTGLMYTRPDWFIYAGAVLFGFFIFQADIRDRTSWAPALKVLSLALAISIALYLPWLVWTWAYYGSPIPNTILAKANLKSYALASVAKDLLLFPYDVIKRKTCAEFLFLPPYVDFGGWPTRIVTMSFLLGSCSMLAIFVRGAPLALRALSVSGAILVFYLSRISGQGPMPWYLPSLSVQFIIVAAGMIGFLTQRLKIRTLPFLTAGLVVFCSFVLIFSAIEMQLQQRLIEWGHRREIGLWLRENSRKGDTVFTECLGYIGYFSQLKTYDFPGMSSPEVVAAVSELKARGRIRFASIIEKLKPDFLVLRPYELEQVHKDSPQWFGQTYTAVKLFDVSAQLPRDRFIPGLPYLEIDSKFVVLKKR